MTRRHLIDLTGCLLLAVAPWLAAIIMEMVW
jgi:hypothetical protein